MLFKALNSKVGNIKRVGIQDIELEESSERQMNEGWQITEKEEIKEEVKTGSDKETL